MADASETKGDAGEAAVEYKGKVNLVSQEGDKFEVPKKVRSPSYDAPPRSRVIF